MNSKELIDLQNDTFIKCAKILKQKNHDYSGSLKDDADADALKNFNIARIFNINPIKGVLLRVSDKLQRVNTFVTNDKLEVSDETINDACDDIINYMVLIKALHKQNEKEENKPKYKHLLQEYKKNGVIDNNTKHSDEKHLNEII